MKNLGMRAKMWLKVTLKAKGLVAALCICVAGLASLPWAPAAGHSWVMLVPIFLFVSIREISNIIVIMINEEIDETKNQREERFVEALLNKCSTPKDVQDLLGKEAMKSLGSDIVRKRQTEEWWRLTDSDG